MPPPMRNTYLMQDAQNSAQQVLPLMATMPPMGSIPGSMSQYQYQNKRNALIFNEKILLILSGNYMCQMHCLDANLLRAKFLKR